MIIVIDYGMGNLRSVERKLKRVGADVRISSGVEEINKASKLILPGVGHFGKAVRNLKDSGIWEVLNKKVLKEKTPILGICLGMQLMANYSEEGNVKGLGWFDANVIKFKIDDKLKFKVPHIGWNQILIEKKSELLKNIPKDSMFYFVHSYHIICNNSEDILTSTEYEYKFTSAIQKDNIYGTQFHPEKSHDDGEILFENFLKNT